MGGTVRVGERARGPNEWEWGLVRDRRSDERNSEDKRERKRGRGTNGNTGKGGLARDRDGRE